MDQTTPLCSIIGHISIQLINLKIFLNIFSYSVSKSSSAFSDLTTLLLINSPYYKIYKSSLYMPKPSKPSSFYHLFYCRCYPNLSNVVISNPFPSSLTSYHTSTATSSSPLPLIIYRMR